VVLSQQCHKSESISIDTHTHILGNLADAVTIWPALTYLNRPK